MWLLSLVKLCKLKTTLSRKASPVSHNIDPEPLVFATEAQEQMFNDIRTELPNFPHSLIYHWLLPFAEDIGWPPVFNGDPMAKIARWQSILKKPLSYWSAVVWSLECLNPNQLTFAEKELRGFQDMILGHAYGRQTLLTIFLGESSKRRFFRQVSDLLTMGVFTEPPVIIDNGTHIDLVDGSHRMAALVFVMNDSRVRAAHELRGWPSEPLSETHYFWVGYPPAGNPLSDSR